MTLSFLVERVRHGSVLSTSEVKILVEELERLTAKLEGCAQEVARRDEADKVSRQADRDRAKQLHDLEDEVKRVRAALAHEIQRYEVRTVERDDRERLLEGILKDIHYGLLYQPELTREELAGVIATEVTPHAKPGK
jgi:hypothetical protein